MIQEGLIIYYVFSLYRCEKKSTESLGVEQLIKFLGIFYPNTLSHDSRLFFVEQVIKFLGIFYRITMFVIIKVYK